MVQRLNDAIRATDPWSTYSRGQERIDALRASLQKPDSNPFHHVGVMLSLGDELLNAGQTEEALKTYESAEKAVKQDLTGSFQVSLPYMLLKRKAMCYLRMGEQQNCCASNNADSCLLPIHGQGIHQKPFGSREGMRLLTRQLQVFPGDLAARWSLNIAAMTLGIYPDKVPARWLIPPRVFRSDYDIQRFPNVAPALGLDLEGLAGGCVMEDFEGNGFLDLMVCRSGVNEPLRYFHNNGDGTFTERTQAAGLSGLVGGINLIQADYNNDGNPDVLVLRGEGLPCSLLRNNGDGTFDDVTEQAGLHNVINAQTAVWLDYNGDGYLDLFVGNATVLGDPTPRPCQLFRNNGDGTFTECAHACGLDLVGNVKGVISADYNNDGRPDLYLSRSGQPNLLLRNDGPKTPGGDPKGPWTFTDVTAAAGVAQPIQSYACCFFDYDNDGWPDLFVTGSTFLDSSDVARDYLGLPSQGERPRLYHNNHDGTFTDVTHQTHLDKMMMGQAVNFGDLDNDGFLDLYVGTGSPNLGDLVPKRMFRNAGGRYFQEVTTSGDFGHLQKGSAISFGDLFNNGNQDIYEVMGGFYAGDVAHNALYRNPGHGNHWVTLTLEGVRSNRSAIGARIQVTVATPTGTRAIYRTVSSGGSFGASPLRQEIGLGQATAILSATIFWPTTSKTQVVTGLQRDHRYKIREEGVGR